MAKKKITDVVVAIMAEYPEEKGCVLYDQEFVKEGPDRYLRVYIDKADGSYVGTDDCEEVSRFLSEALDREDPIEDNYFLEVSSPGLDRKLTKPEHFQKAMGSDVEVSLYKALEGSKHFTGKLKGYRDGNVTIDIDGKELEFTGDMISKINLAVII